MKSQPESQPDVDQSSEFQMGEEIKALYSQLKFPWFYSLSLAWFVVTAIMAYVVKLSGDHDWLAMTAAHLCVFLCMCLYGISYRIRARYINYCFYALLLCALIGLGGVYIDRIAEREVYMSGVFQIRPEYPAYVVGVVLNTVFIAMLTLHTFIFGPRKLSVLKNVARLRFDLKALKHKSDAS